MSALTETIDPKALLPGDIITVRLAVSQVHENGVVIASSGRLRELHSLCPTAEILSVKRPKPKPKVGDFVQFEGGSGYVWEIVSGQRTQDNGVTEWGVWSPEWGYSFIHQAWIDTATIVDRPDWAGEAGGE